MEMGGEMTDFWMGRDRQSTRSFSQQGYPMYVNAIRNQQTQRADLIGHRAAE
jgi:hypothetical protein